MRAADRLIEWTRQTFQQLLTDAQDWWGCLSTAQLTSSLKTSACTQYFSMSKHFPKTAELPWQLVQGQLTDLASGRVGLSENGDKPTWILRGHANAGPSWTRDHQQSALRRLRSCHGSISTRTTDTMTYHTWARRLCGARRDGWHDTQAAPPCPPPPVWGWAPRGRWAGPWWRRRRRRRRSRPAVSCSLGLRLSFHLEGNWVVVSFWLHLVNDSFDPIKWHQCSGISAKAEIKGKGTEGRGKNLSQTAEEFNWAEKEGWVSKTSMGVIWEVVA